jgi:hypothetical protein
VPCDRCTYANASRHANRLASRCAGDRREALREPGVPSFASRFRRSLRRVEEAIDYASNHGRDAFHHKQPKRPRNKPASDQAPVTARFTGL